MEAALTAKEFEEGKRNLPKGVKKGVQLKSSDLWDEEEDEPTVPSKEDTARWRHFQKEKNQIETRPSQKYSIHG